MSEDDPLVTVCQVMSTEHARIAVIKMKLKGAGIGFSAVNDMASAAMPVDGVEIVRFQVLQRDAERAATTLRELGLA